MKFCLTRPNSRHVVALYLVAFITVSCVFSSHFRTRRSYQDNAQGKQPGLGREGSDIVPGVQNGGQGYLKNGHILNGSDYNFTDTVTADMCDYPHKVQQYKTLIDPFRVSAAYKHPKMMKRVKEGLTCAPLHRSVFDLRRTALASYQGSGNTWVRHLIHQLTGIYSGSVYNDLSLAKGGDFPFETRKNRNLSVIKTHEKTFFLDYIHFEAGIVIVRNLYDALLSNYKFVTSRYNHTGQISIGDFKKEDWKSFVDKEVDEWLQFYKEWLVHFPCDLLVLRYEDLVRDLRPHLVRIGHFLGVDPKFLYNEHMDCVIRNSEGNFKRKSKALENSPFTTKMNITIDKYMQEVDRLIVARETK